MMKNHYLSKKERELVGSEFRKSHIYKYLRTLALRCDTLGEYFTLSPEDLFYHTMCTVDTLIDNLQNEEEEEILYCNDLWYELKSHFAEHVSCGEEDCKLAATLIICTTLNLLNICNRPKYWNVCDALRDSVKEGDEQTRVKLENIIDDVLYEQNVYDDIQSCMTRYTRNERSLSGEIEDKILELREQCNLTGLENEEEIISHLKTFFKNKIDNASTFLYNINGQEDSIVIDEIVEQVKSKKMVINNKSKLWKILNDSDLYQATKVNFSTVLKNRGI